MSTALIIGKFMPFHTGHKYLIDFAYNYHGVQKVLVLVDQHHTNTIDPYERLWAIHTTYAYDSVVAFLGTPDMPQQPADDPEFWQKWVANIRRVVNDPDLIVFAGEDYGVRLAQELGAKFVPVVNRADWPVIDVSGTMIRTSMAEHWDKIVPAMRRRLNRKVTIFGSESVGKSTLARQFDAIVGYHSVPEYARTYLDIVGTEITDDKMQDIVYGQYCQDTCEAIAEIAQTTIRDTDLMTTYGYLDLLGKDPDRIQTMKKFIEDTAPDWHADLYLLIDTDIEFTADPQRYGGDHRTSDTKFWQDILDKFGAKYIKISGDRLAAATTAIEIFFDPPVD